jgi:hypothetical protein
MRFHVRLSFLLHLSIMKRKIQHPQLVSVSFLSLSGELKFFFLASISIIIKSLKPIKSFDLQVQPTDPISSIKSQLASKPGAPPASTQRLLLRGKALADGKLLKEYDVKEGDTINLMVKPGYDWDPTRTKELVLDSSGDVSPVPAETPPLGASSDLKPVTQTRQSRAPSIVLSPSPSSRNSPLLETKPLDIDITHDSTASSTRSQSTYHVRIANPVFWERMYSFLR